MMNKGTDDIDRNSFQFDDVGDALHERLHIVCRHLPSDLQPYGQRIRNGPDCSSGCKYFLQLPGELGLDWGVCVNPRSPRSGLLTFEHQGCEFFEAGPETLPYPPPD